MAQQPTLVRGVTHHLLFLVIAIICFVIAVFVALGDVTAKWEAALIPAGLAFFAASFL